MVYCSYEHLRPFTTVTPHQYFSQPPRQAGRGVGLGHLTLANPPNHLRFRQKKYKVKTKPIHYCILQPKTVTKNHTISLFGHTLLLAVPRRNNLAGQRVELCHRLDGRLALFFKGEKLTMLQPAQLGPPELEQFNPLSS